MTNNNVYSLDEEIATFFAKTTATHSACDTYAKEHLGGDIIPVTVQGVCSYTVYAGPNADSVVQFRLETQQLKMETAHLARAIYGEYAPDVDFRCEIGDESGDKEPLYIYVMSRVQGISYLEFIMKHSDIPENSPEFSSWRQTLIADIARFFALSWKSPQPIDQTHRTTLYSTYKKDLKTLQIALPPRFQPHVHSSLHSLPSISTLLPTVQLHRDLGAFNILVNNSTCTLTGVIDWAGAEIAPFGLNLHSHQRLFANIHLRHGWSRFADYAACEEVFWRVFCGEVGGLSAEVLAAVTAARVLGTLLSVWFTGRLPGMPAPVPIREDDEGGAYRMRELDGLLVKPETRFLDLE